MRDSSTAPGMTEGDPQGVTASGRQRGDRRPAEVCHGEFVLWRTVVLYTVGALDWELAEP